MDNAADDIEVFLLAKRCMCRCKLKLPAVLGDIVYDLMLTCGPCNLSEVEILADIFIMCGRHTTALEYIVFLYIKWRYNMTHSAVKNIYKRIYTVQKKVPPPPSKVQYHS